MKDHNITVLNDDSSSEIKFIYHLSDIHIKAIINDDLKEHYIDIIEKVCNIIKQNPKNSLIVIAGDTLDTVYSSHSIDMIKYLFYKLSSLCPVLYCSGNHELQSKRDLTQSDMLTPLVSNYFKSDHTIFPLLAEGLYRYNNLMFGLTEMKSLEVTPCSKNKKYIRIGLHHGQVSHDRMDGIVKKQCNIDVKQFEKYYDYTLLGDCHTFTYLNDLKTVAYSGSLYETNFRETNIKKGLIKWDIIKGKSEFINIDGIIKHVILKVIDGKLIDYNKNTMPQKAKVKIIYSNTTQDELDIIEKKIRENSAIIEYITERDMNDTYMNSTVTIGKDGKKIDDIENADTVVKMIMEYLKKDGKKYDSKRVTKYLNDVLDEIDFNFDTKSSIMKLKNIKFNNINLYGVDNVINFRSYEGKICELNGKNGIGKSSIITVLLLGLYNECDYGIKYDCLNIKNMKDGASVIVEFDVNGVGYKVKRTINVKSHAKRECEEDLLFYKEGKNITGKDNIETQKKIIKLIGSYDNIINTNIILQKNYKSFTDLSNLDKKKVIAKVSKLDIFDELAKHIRSDMSSCNQNIPKIKKQISVLLEGNDEETIDDELDEARDILEKKTKTKKRLEKERDELTKKKIGVECKMNEYADIDIGTYNVKEYNTLKKKYDSEEYWLNSNVESVDEINEMLGSDKFRNFEKRRKKFYEEKQGRLDELIEEKNGLLLKILPDGDLSGDKKHIDYLEKKVLTLEKNVLNNQQSMKSQKNNIVEIDDNIPEKYQKYKKMTDDMKKLESDKARTLSEINKYKKEQKNIGEIEHDKNCKYCVKLRNKITFQENIDILEEQMDDCNEKINEINTKLEKYGDYDNIYLKHIASVNSNKDIENDIKNLKNIIQMNEKELKDCQRELDDYKKKYEKNVETEKQNSKNKTKLSEIDNKIKSCKQDEFSNCDEYDELIENKTEFTKNIAKAKSNLGELDDAVKLLENKKEKYDDNIKKIQESKILEKELAELNNKSKNINDELDDMTEAIDKNNKIVIKNEIISKQMEGLNNDLKKMENKKSVAGLISKVLEKDGLQDQILVHSIIPKIELEVNALLKIISNFQIEIKYLKKTLQVYKIVNKKYRVLKLSGYENIALNVAFRLTFCNLSQNKYNFLFFDEIFSFADYDTLQNISRLFDYIRDHFDITIVISHNDDIKKFCDESFQIEKVDGFSRICVE